jgi:hypothetical protein
MEARMGRWEIVVIAVLVIGGASSPRAQNTADALVQRQGADDLQPKSAITDTFIFAVTQDYQLVGREVAIDDVRVRRVSPYGFWIATSNAQQEVFVIPAEGRLIAATAGTRVSIHGEVRQMLGSLRRLLFDRYARHEQFYIHAFTVRPTGLWEDVVPREDRAGQRLESSNRN